MSGLTPADARALAWLAKRVRQETSGCAPWDEPGIMAELRRCEGHSVAVTVERVIRHAADPTAQTPGAIRRPFLPEVPTSGPPRPPRAGEHCRTCGKRLTATCCDNPTTRPRGRTTPPTGWRETKEDEG